MLSTPGLDTWLAQLLLERRRLPLETLTGLMQGVRERRADEPQQTLAVAIKDAGLMQSGELLAVLRELNSAAPGSDPAPRTRSAGSGSGSGSGRAPRRVVAGYLLRKQLGAGGMGAVFSAEHVQTGALRALKLLSCPNRELRERFTREGQAQAALDAHPAIARIYAAGVDDGIPYLVIERVSGGDLADRLRTGPLPIDEAVALVIALARGVAHAHAQGILHRDLKPGNVLLTETGAPKLVDFGLAQVPWAGSLTETGALLGTPAYMAPEQADPGRGEVSPRTDVYGLGAILYQTISGLPPFSAGSVFATLAAVMTDPPTPLTQLRPETPPELNAVCLRALAKAPEQRFATAEAFAQALEGLSPEPPKPTPWGAVAAGVALTGALVLGGWALLAPREPLETPSAELPNRQGAEAPSAADRAAREQALAEVREWIKRGKLEDAAQALDALEPPPPMELRWSFALRQLGTNLRREDQRLRAAERRAATNRPQADRALVNYLAAHEVCAADLALVQSLSGADPRDGREQVARSLLEGLARLHAPAALTPARAEVLRLRLLLIQALSPDVLATQELKAFLPTRPFSGAVKHDALIAFGETLASLSPADPVLHAKIADWVNATGDHALQARLLTMTRRAVEFETDPERRAALRLNEAVSLAAVGRGIGEVAAEGRRSAEAVTTLILETNTTPSTRGRAYVLRARVRLQQRNAEGAAADLTAALAIHDSHRLHLPRAQAYADLGRNEEATADLLRFLDLEPPLSAVDPSRALALLWRVARQDRALLEERIRVYLERWPMQPGWRARLALLRFEAGDALGGAELLEAGASQPAFHHEALRAQRRGRELARELPRVAAELRAGTGSGLVKLVTRFQSCQNRGRP